MKFFIFEKNYINYEKKYFSFSIIFIYSFLL
jgi:hypothetical protein